MEFFAFSRSSTNPNTHKTFKKLYSLSATINGNNIPQYWFVFHKKNTIIAECEVNKKKSLFSRKTDKIRYEISSVFVNPSYRGNEYCSLLLLNVMYYFDLRNPNKEQLTFQLFTHRLNYSARKAYRKIFEKESVCYRGKFVYFSTEVV